MSPKRLGRFEIIDMLGRGAMGCVYLAHDPRIDRKVAIKTLEGLSPLNPEESRTTRARFLREAQAAGRLSHPNIITIFDVGEEGETPYIAMEFLDGRTFDAFTEAPNLLPVPDVISYVCQACDALQYAHTAGIIHRDIKPANMMLLPGGVLKITDFGLAKRPDTNLTTEGLLVGTPYYMSPEQIRGDTLDGRSDLFSLGVVLYQLLNGSLPFPGESIHTVIHRIMTEAPAEFPPQRSIPEPLKLLVRGALEKDPARRIASGEEFGSELRRIAHETGLAGSLGPSPSASSGSRKTIAAPARTLLVTPEPASSSRHLPARPRRGKKILGIATIAAVLVASAAVAWLAIQGRNTGAGPVPASSTAAAPAELADTGPTIRIDADPSATLLLDGKPLAGPSFRLVKDDRSRHVVRAEQGCRVAEREIDGGSPPATVRLDPSPEKISLPVASAPSGATITVNGSPSPGKTPTTIALDRCRDNRVALALGGYKGLEFHLAPGEDPAPLRAALAEVAFRNQEPGRLKVAPGPYEATVFVDGRSAGAPGTAITLPAGRHRVELVNDSLFMRLAEALTIVPSQEHQWKPDYPQLGALTVQATPTNCSIHLRPEGETSFRYLDDLPIVRHRLASGSYTIRCTLQSSGQSQERPVEVLPGANVQVDFTFNR